MTNNKQQTAVGLYRIKISSLTSDLFKEKISGEQFRTLEKEAYEQAKEKDKEQKLNMFNCGRQYQVTGEGTFKQVYEEIHGGGEQ